MDNKLITKGNNHQKAYNFNIIKESIKLPTIIDNSYLPFSFHNKTYLLQCYSSVPQKQQLVHCLTQQAQGWKTINTVSFRNKSGSIQYPKVGTTYTVLANNLFCFDSKDSSKNDSKLSVLNLNTMEWSDFQLPSELKNIDSKNSIKLMPYKSIFLIVAFTNNDQSNLNFWIFNTQSRKWQQAYHKINYKVMIQSFCVANDRIQFVSKIQSSSQYQLVCALIQYNSQKECFNIQIEDQEIHSQITFQSNSKVVINYHDCKLLFVFHQVPCSISQTNSQQVRLIIFDILTQNFVQTFLTTDRQRNNIIVSEKSIEFYFFSKNKHDPIQHFKIPDQFMDQIINKQRFQNWRDCQICYETYINKNSLMEPAFKVSREMLQSIAEKIDFPFAALGNFADIAYHHSANFINFHFTQYKNQPILRIQDDSRPNYTNGQIQEILVNFSAQINCNFSSIQKKTKSIQMRDFFKRQYGTNIKISSLRLGSEMLYVSTTHNYEVRVAYFVLENDQYVCYFYVFDQKNNKIFDDFSSQTKLFVQSRHGQLINSALHSNVNDLKYPPYKNTIFILGLKTVKTVYGKQILELQPFSNQQTCDIMYTSPSQITYKTYIEHGSRINQALDTSFAAYMSNFFLKNEYMKIFIQVKEGQKREIRKEDVLENADKNALIKVITPIDNLLAHNDLKYVDLIVNNKLNKKTGVFNNGVLIYHKNRLIKRFGCQLGNLLPQLQMCNNISYNYFNIFGSIQLPDPLEVNQQKTDFVNQLMLQKIYSRLRLIHESFAKNYEIEKQDIKQSKESKHHSYKEGPKLRPRINQQYEARHAPSKKVKRCQDDDSYHLN